MSGPAEPGYEQLAGAIRDIPDYPSAGVLFKDITPLLADPELFGAAVTALAGLPPTAPGTPAAAPASGAARAAAEGRFGAIDMVAGIEARGFILAAPVALALDAGFVPIRKKGKLPSTTVGASYQLEYGTAEIELHTDAISPGQRVLLVDDVLATGGTAAAAHGLLTSLGADVVALSMLMELEFLHGREQLPGIELHALLRY